MPKGGKPGRLAHGYQVRIEKADQFVPEFGQLWGIEGQLPEDWNQFQQENIGNPAVKSAQIYRSRESRKNMQYRHIRDEFVNE